MEATPPTGQDIFDELDRLGEEIKALHRGLRGVHSIAAVINANGTVNRGDDNFTVTKNGTGDYTIVFDDAFDTIPLVQLSIDATAANLGVRLDSTTAVSTGGFRVRVFTTTSGAATDGPFTFMASLS